MIGEGGRSGRTFGFVGLDVGDSRLCEKDILLTYRVMPQGWYVRKDETLRLETSGTCFIQKTPI